ncbi:MAG: Asp-tRNA(Asn)/Glu-tRNA(Gln) amidotransferase subunit GatC [Thermodesulfobacteriota bacterium]
MKLSPEQVRNVARLARLELGPEEIDALAAQLDRILSYVDKLNELDTTGITPVTGAMGLTNAFRDDAVAPSLANAEALANAPQDNGASFVVPRIL